VTGDDRRHPKEPNRIWFDGEDSSIVLVSRVRRLESVGTAEIAYSPPSGPGADVVRNPEELEFASTEVATALTLTRRAADAEMGLALQLCERLPAVWRALDEGRIDVRRAREFDKQTAHLPTDEARDLVDRVITGATDLTTGQLRARLQRLSLDVDPQAAKTRYEEGVGERRLQREANPDGTASLLGLNLAPNKTGAAFTKINDVAQRLKRKGDPRTMDQIRADVFLDLLLGGHRAKTSRKGFVDIRVDLKTLTELTETPGELAGYGPVIADIARQVALDQPNAEFRFAVTNDDDQIVHVGTTKRRPTSSMKRLVQAQHPTCVFRGCRMPAIDCDIDHRVAVVDGGPTTPCNLTPLCRHHHRAKHDGGWQYVKHRDGFTFISPLGHHYTSGARSP
jgi:Domain of unknown function (DUF222)/HNH endonuclease